MELYDDLLWEVCQRDFWEFCLHYDYKFFSKRPILKQVADGLQLIFDGKIKKMAICLPPRSGKSYLISLFIAWWLGNRPYDSMMRNTCTARLYNKFSYDTREIIKSERYLLIFPHIYLKEDKKNLDVWNLSTSKQVAYFGAGVGGTIIGFGCSGVAFTDDLYKSIDDALSDKTNENVSRWRESSHDSRLEHGCPVVDIGTRWTKRDEIGKKIEAKFYDLVIKIPALIDGKSFCEEVKSTEEYTEIRRSIEAEIWEAEYMQEPIESKGLLFHKEELQYFSELPTDKPLTKLAYIDVADEGDDNLAAAFGLIYKEKIYISDIVFSKETIDLTMPMIAEVEDKLKMNYIRVEVNNQGGGFIREARRVMRVDKILKVRTTSNKTTRIWNNYGFIKRYFIFRHESTYAIGSQYDMFMRNVLSYMRDGSSKRRDAPDCLAGLSIFAQGSAGHLFPAKTDEEKEQLKKNQENFVRERQ